MKGLWQSKLDFVDGEKHSYRDRRKKVSFKHHLLDNISHYFKTRKKASTVVTKTKYTLYNILLDIKYDDMLGNTINKEFSLIINESVELTDKLIRRRLRDRIYKGILLDMSIISIKEMNSYVSKEKHTTIESIENNPVLFNKAKKFLNNGKWIENTIYDIEHSKKWKKVSRNRKDRRNSRMVSYENEIMEHQENSWCY